MRPVTTTTLSDNWTVRYLRPGNVAAAIDSVSARITKGLATDEGRELTRQSTPPAGLAERTFRTTIPADVHMVLEEAGVIDDPHLGLNEFRTQWIGRGVWEFATEFTISDTRRRTDLVFHGVDTVAEIFFNGQLVAEAHDMNVPLTLEVTAGLRHGANSLCVVFAAQEDWAERQQELRGSYPNAYTDPTNQIRKMACNYGWDWGPTLVTVGLWKPVELVQYDARLDQFSVVAWAEGATGRLAVSGAISGHDSIRELDVSLDSSSRIRILLDGRELLTRGVDEQVNLDLSVDEVELWWPRGYGDQPLYTLTVELLDSTGTVLDREQRRVGFRSTEVLSEPDEHGTSWALLVNGERIWARGANWIPADTSIARVTREDYRARIADALAANMNILRVWGGGIYESNDFYELCDEAGVVVWQDALFACAAYPEDDDMRALVTAEVSHATRRLASHPSLVLWNGSNENIWGHADWDWQEPLAGRSWGLGYYLDLIPTTISTIDRSRPYTPSSPWSGTLAVHPNADAHGTTHLWEQWNRQDYLTYLDTVPRFVSEYGYQSPAAWSTLARALGTDQLSEDSPAMRAHQKAFDGRAKLRRAVELRFGEPRDFDDWHFLTQLEHARALRLAIHHLRAHHDVCSGSIIWQLNDCWPAVSWSLVDVAGQRKPAWFAVRDAYRDTLLTLQGGPDVLTAAVINDTGVPVAGAVTIDVMDMQGSITTTVTVPVSVSARSFTRLELSDVVRVTDPTTTYVRARMGELKSFAFFAVDRELRTPLARYRVTSARKPTGVELTITADTLVRDLCLSPDRRDADAVVTDNVITLAPGDAVTVTIRTEQPELFETASWGDMIRCANDPR
jgi:beta-mannosidase